MLFSIGSSALGMILATRCPRMLPLMRPYLALTCAALALLPLAPTQAQLPVQQAAPVPLDGTLLEVTAEGRTTRTPDLATLRAGVVTQAATASQAFSANSRQMAAVIAAVRKAGVAPRDLQTASVSLQPQYRYEPNQAPVLTGYQASNTVTVRLRDIAQAGSVVDALVTAGANQVDGPTLSLAEPDAALDEARRDAVARARARADLYAKAAGLSVVRVLSIAENGAEAGPTPPPMMMARERADAAPQTEIAPGERDVTARLSVRFLLR